MRAHLKIKKGASHIRSKSNLKANVLHSWGELFLSEAFLMGQNYLNQKITRQKINLTLIINCVAGLLALSLASIVCHSSLLGWSNFEPLRMAKSFQIY